MQSIDVAVLEKVVVWYVGGLSRLVTASERRWRDYAIEGKVRACQRLEVRFMETEHQGLLGWKRTRRRRLVVGLWGAWDRDYATPHAIGSVEFRVARD